MRVQGGVFKIPAVALNFTPPPGGGSFRRNYFCFMQIAQINIAKMIAPLDSEVMKEFREFLDPVNQLAESSPGFVWRYTEEEGPDTPWAYDDHIVVNLSVWEGIDPLKEFVYNSVHSYFIRSRKKWFSQLGHPHTVLWWVEDGHVPTLDEAKAKLDYLEQHGPSSAAFLFGKFFGAES